MAARLTRAKKKIAQAGIPLATPVKEELQARLDEVCRTIYLAFTAGYAPGNGPDLLRVDLAGDAVQLAVLLHDLVPEADQVRAMLALLMLQHARRDARQCDGSLVLLADQNRMLWKRDEIRAGIAFAHSVRPEMVTRRNVGCRLSSPSSTRRPPRLRRQTGQPFPPITKSSRALLNLRLCGSTALSRPAKRKAHKRVLHCWLVLTKLYLAITDSSLCGLTWRIERGIRSLRGLPT